jgi:hypothetical protein
MMQRRRRGRPESWAAVLTCRYLLDLFPDVLRSNWQQSAQKGEQSTGKLLRKNTNVVPVSNIQMAPLTTTFARSKCLSTSRPPYRLFPPGSVSTKMTRLGRISTD